jgi:diguanylate cyclase (GGDEF)-like protein/putative nucleotidyltransferase with HDIG domain
MNKVSGPNLKWKSKLIAWFVFLASFPVLWLVYFQFGPTTAFLIIAAGMIAIAGYNLFFKDPQHRTKQLLEAGRVHLATVEALATAIDARDQVGKGHVRRTQIYAVGLGNIMGLAADDINALRTGALLHDIGKLAVPDHILNKPGSLTPAELEKTKIHSLVGASILEKVGFDYPVVPTVKYHHECWDGSGYPDGLKADEIPLTARILTVADAFDTLRGARPYRSAMTRQEARRILKDETGTRFDPSIVRTFMIHLPALEAEIDAAGLSYRDSEINDIGIDTHSYVEQIKLANREVFSLYELAREFSSSLNLNETLDMFAAKIGEFVPYDTCIVYLLDETRRTATAAHVDGHSAEVLISRRIKVGQGATGFALDTIKTVENVDPALDFVYSQSELAGQYLTLAAVPLTADDKLIGAVTIYSRELEHYGQENIRLLETISRIASDAIGKSLTHDEAKAHAMTDPMTGLPNARSLQIHFEKEVARAGRSNTSFQLLMLDLDGFKAVNDSFGHKVGDKMLAQIGRVIREQLRDYDFLARYGGDEFVALIPETTSIDVSDLCHRIEHAVGHFSLQVSEHKFASVGVSLGASGYSKDGDTFDQLIVAADRAMYECKKNRKEYLLTGNDEVKIFGQKKSRSGESHVGEFDDNHGAAMAATR